MESKTLPSVIKTLRFVPQTYKVDKMLTVGVKYVWIVDSPSSETKSIYSLNSRYPKSCRC